MTNNTMVNPTSPLSGGTAGTPGLPAAGGAGGIGNPYGQAGGIGVAGASGNAGNGGRARGAFISTGSTVSFYNNIVAGTWTSIPVNTTGLEQTSDATITINYNLVWNWNLRYNAIATPGNDLNQDPNFSSATNHHLGISSPAVDSGLDSAPARPADDHDGNTRPQDGNYDGVTRTDRGAYERAGIRVTKQVSSATVRPNGTITYTITLDASNLAPGVNVDVSVTDEAPAGTTYNDHLTYTSGSVSEGPTGFTWNGMLARSQIVTIRFQVVVVATSGTVTNTAGYTDNDGAWTTNQVVTTVISAGGAKLYLPTIKK
jgi:uncharacterized repeat protein (TIGR01451 family)